MIRLLLLLMAVAGVYMGVCIVIVKLQKRSNERLEQPSHRRVQENICIREHELKLLPHVDPEIEALCAICRSMTSKDRREADLAQQIKRRRSLSDVAIDAMEKHDISADEARARGYISVLEANQMKARQYDREKLELQIPYAKREKLFEDALEAFKKYGVSTTNEMRGMKS